VYSTALLLPPSANSPRSSTTAAARSSGKKKNGSAKSAVDGGLLVMGACEERHHHERGREVRISGPIRDAEGEWMFENEKGNQKIGGDREEGTQKTTAKIYGQTKSCPSGAIARPQRPTPKPSAPPVLLNDWANQHPARLVLWEHHQRAGDMMCDASMGSEYVARLSCCEGMSRH
jgi:hypothetical protein